VRTLVCVKVSIVRGGGLLGVPTRTELDSAHLPADAAADLAEKVAAAGSLAAASAPAETAYPEEPSYEVTLEDGEAHTGVFTESTLPRPVRELVEWTDARPEAKRGIEPPPR
jgi:putative NIF3 family GTP cyclohydrolase 1 type 2